MSKPDGGPAFPLHIEDAQHAPYAKTHTGMTLRDYFAAKALQAIVGWADSPGRKDGETWHQATARLAYEYADAMLAERAKP